MPSPTSTTAHLLLLPGLLCDADLWQHQIKHFKDKVNCQVPDTAKQDSMAAIAASVLAAAPPKFALAGLSMGGYVALEIMRRAPQRVERLCLLDTSARADSDEQREKRRLLLKMSETGQFKGVTPRLLPMLIHPDRIQDKPLTTIITGMAERMGRAAFRNQQTAIMTRPDSRADLSKIKCPVQIIGGRQDALTGPEIVQEIATGIPDARLTIIEECGHLSPLEKPDEVTRLMESWLAA